MLSAITPRSWRPPASRRRLQPRQLEGGARSTASNTRCRFDIHSIILYYNKDLLKKAGLLGDDGKPKGLDGVDNFNAALKKLKDNGVEYGVSIARPPATAQLAHLLFAARPAGRRQFLKDGKFLDGDNLDKAVKARSSVMHRVGQERLAPSRPSIPASIALFTSGKAAMHINGVWEVPTMTDLAKKRQARLRLGRDPDPDLLRPAGDLGRLAFLRHPQRKGKEIDPEKRKAVLDVIDWMNEHRCAGRRPATSRPSCRSRD